MDVALVAAYLARIGIKADPSTLSPNEKTLALLIAAQTRNVPFEVCNEQ